MRRKDKDFLQGVGLALAEVYRRNDDDVTVTEVAKALNYTIKDFTAAGIEEEDLVYLRKALNNGMEPTE